MYCLKPNESVLLKLFHIALSKSYHSRIWLAIFYIINYIYIFIINMRFLGKPSTDTIDFLSFAYEKVFLRKLPFQYLSFYYLYGKQLIHIYTVGGEKAGFALFRIGPLHNIHLTLFGILEPFRGKGQSKLFLADSLTYWKSQGFTSASLYVSNHNEIALRAFRSLGFKPAKDFGEKIYMVTTL